MITYIIKRLHYFEDCTLGEMYRDDGHNEPMFVAFTLEDKVRPLGEKVWGETAIPYGKYPTVINYSNRFKRLMPLLQDVSGFEGCRIHGGNKAADTHGCILVARNIDIPGHKIYTSEEATVCNMMHSDLMGGDKICVEVVDAR